MMCTGRLLRNLQESVTYREGIEEMKAAVSEEKQRASDPFFDIQLSPVSVHDFD